MVLEQWLSGHLADDHRGPSVPELQERLPEVGQPHPGHGAVAQHPLPPAQSGAHECRGPGGGDHGQGGEPRRLPGEHRGSEDPGAADSCPERARLGLPAHDRHRDGLLHLRLAGHPARHPHRGLPQEPRWHGPLHGGHQGASRVRRGRHGRHDLCPPAGRLRTERQCGQGGRQDGSPGRREDRIVVGQQVRPVRGLHSSGGHRGDPLPDGNGRLGGVDRALGGVRRDHRLDLPGGHLHRLHECRARGAGG